MNVVATSRATALAGILTLLTTVPVHAEASRGLAIAITDAGLKAVVGVDIQSGNRRVISGPAVGRGPSLGGLTNGITFDCDGNILVTDENNDRVTRIDPHTGDRTTVSGLDVGAPENLFSRPFGVVATKTDIYVADFGANTLLRVDPLTGDRTVVVSEYDNPAIGGPDAITLDPHGQILLVEFGGIPGVLRVDPLTGLVAMVTGPGVGRGPSLGDEDADLEGVAYANGRIFVSEQAPLAAIFSVRPSTGHRTIVSGAGVGDGPDLISPRGVAADGRGHLFVVDAGLDALLRISVATGDREIISSASVGGGPRLEMPLGIAFAPHGSERGCR